MMAHAYGAYNNKTKSYIAVDLDNVNYTLYGATAEQYQQSNDPLGEPIYTEDLRRLNRNQYPSLSNITDSQITKYFSGENPLGIAEKYRYEGQELLWKNLDSPEKQKYLDGIYGDAWRTFNSEDSATLLNDSNYGPEAFDLNLNFGFGRPPANTRSVGNQGSFNILKYPLDMDLSVQDHMAITAATYVPAGPNGLPTVTQATDRGQFVRTRNEQLHETILIPMPNAIASRDSVEFGKGEMGGVAGSIAGGAIGAALGTEFEGTNTLSALGDAAKKAAETTFKGVTDVAGSGYLKRKLLLSGVSALTSAIGVNFDVGQVVKRTSGAVENPNLELLFQGPALRDFTFQIRFSPRSRPEAARVRQIIRTLKQRMSVKRNATAFEGQGGANLLLGTPDVFRLEYRRGSTTNEEIKGLNKFKTCVLKSLEVNYSGGTGRWSAYGPDSQPVTTLVTMQFTEIVPIYEDDYRNSNFDNDDVGF
ncbi:baseplate tail tube cap [Synechococcus phage S-CAM9]|uniref:Baseplate tail tube cap n=1 Tax=Synechococcus phage S-CAM9 TaxID=1883369 RepID=A0A1D8KPN1_9CAUD|nr:baseplate tail tube cap [Synechococcus phage S-CAM9]AOV60152.1 baseplate tail tube cap [Synechococcus phage S-CAM9]AOV60380.1 baseplate tail tube cap [Synechococcus phage S-CAM9]AOV60608.1 baseplate tail tube cap [Synechococcus phage S-CAM9]